MLDKKHHVHSWRRNKKKRYQYHCTNPECFSYYRKDALIGKKCLCANCGNEMEIESYHLKLALIQCNNCLEAMRRRKKLGDLQMELDDLFKEAS